MKIRLVVCALMALLITTFNHAVIADSHEGDVAVIWKVTAKSGEAQAMRDAIAEHMKWRADNGDPWGWTAFSEATGDPVNVIYFRSGDHHWADLDAYDAGEFNTNAGNHWNANVGPHVKYYDRSFTETDRELANWPDDGVYSHFRVFTFTIRGGHMPAFRAALTEAHAALMDGGWESVHGWVWPLDGTMNEASVVVARGDYAGFERNEAGGPWEHIIKSMGSRRGNALREEFNSHIKHVRSEFYVAIPELSIEAAK